MKPFIFILTLSSILRSLFEHVEAGNRMRTKWNRRRFLGGALVAAGAAPLGFAGELALQNETSQSTISSGKAVIDVTDLYHPFEDPGDNLDLVQAYSLPEVDLRGIVLDITDPFRLPIADHPVLWHDPNGPREPGIVPVSQMNALFSRNVPYAYGPFTAMRSLTDPMTDVPRIQQAGIELILATLQQSDTSVEIVSFGSARTIAAAFNREPELFRRKVARIHVSAGAATRNYEMGQSEAHNQIPGGEWNVALDPLAFIRLMRSDLSIALYPCADVDGAFAYGEHNTYWNLPDLHFIREIEPRLRNYVIFALGRMLRADFLRCLNGSLDEADAQDRINRVHHVWETAIWLIVSGRKVVYREGAWRIVPGAQVRDGDRILKNNLRFCTLSVREDGRIAYRLTEEKTNTLIFERGDPHEYEQALRQALPEWWKSFRSVSNT